MSDLQLEDRTFDARPDTMDFRDRMYEPSLIEVPPVVDLDRYRRFGLPILNQGTEGACTGFGLATVSNYLLRKRESDPDPTIVSPRMMYEMARRYDEWPGVDYSGSSARGAMKGWHKHGVCADEVWPYQAGSRPEELTPERVADAATRPLGAYYRVNHKDIVAMHAALAEVGIVYATAVVHEGWDDVSPRSGFIPPRRPSTRMLGGHAFAIVAYNERGFWLQNSWDGDWGFHGFALLSYEDWLTTGTDAWVAQLGAPITVGQPSESLSDFTDHRQPQSYTFHEMRPHVVALGNDGRLATDGTYATNQNDIANIVKRFEEITETWTEPRLVLYAHGGLVPASSAVAQAARMRSEFLNNNIYPIFFVWNTDWYSTLENLISDVYNRWAAEGPAGGPLDFLADRTDDLIENIARTTRVAGAGWAEIKENGIRATDLKQGGARVLADALASSKRKRDFEIHLVGHSAGSILHAALAKYVGTTSSSAAPVRGRGLGLAISSCTLWAPAATIDLYKKTYLGLLQRGRLQSLSLFALRDDAEKDDSAGPYQKSILYLVSNALEERRRIPFFRPDGEAILGMEKFINGSQAVHGLIEAGKIETIITPTGSENVRLRGRSQAKTHVGFSSDRDTLKATILRITGGRSRTSPIPVSATELFEAERSAIGSEIA